MFKPLPKNWVEKLFNRFSLAYGSRFTNMWNANDPEEMLAYWSRELGCFTENTGPLLFGLEHLPDSNPPTLGEFRKLCLGAPRRHLELPGPKSQPGTAAKVLAEFKRPIKGVTPGRLTWAEQLRDRELSGELLSPIQRKCWRQVLPGSAKAVDAGVRHAG